MSKKQKESPTVSSFTIKNLHGEKDIVIPFAKPYKIIVAENGAGKTTVLNIFYLMLSCRFYRLLSYDFDSINVKFSSGEVATVVRKQLEEFSELGKSEDVIGYLMKVMTVGQVENLMNEVRRAPTSVFLNHPQIRRAASMTGITPRHIVNSLRHREHRFGQEQLVFDEMADSPFKEVAGTIQKNFHKDILYFPTYRRIEEDLINLNLWDLDISVSEDNQLIQFGMKDVTKRVHQLTSEIKNSSIEWFSKINGEMLSQLIDGIKVNDEMRKSIKKPEAIRIVLERIGENISEKDKIHILEVVESTEELGARNDPLVYFLSNLIKVYDQQRENDNAIKDFTKVCNNYLVDKEVVYNESKVSIDFLSKKKGKPVSIEKLSSGEKQIISLFSRLYLDSAQDCAIFFDEPELSLSIEWQKQFLPDILKSNRCKFLLATTHSPFIFENELDQYTSDLSEFIKEL